MSEDSPEYSEVSKQSISNLIPDENRLSYALDVLGAGNDSPKHHRYNLVSTIASYAGANGDDSLEAQCQKLMAVIRAQNAKIKKAEEIADRIASHIPSDVSEID